MTRTPATNLRNASRHDYFNLYIQETHENTHHQNTRTARASLPGAVRKSRVQDLLRGPLVAPPRAVQGMHEGAALPGGHLPTQVVLQG